MPRSTHRELMPCGILKAEGQAGEGRAGLADQGGQSSGSPRFFSPGRRQAEDSGERR